MKLKMFKKPHVFVLFASFFFASSAFACRCVAPEVTVAWKKANLVVRAKVDDVIVMPSGEGSSAVVTVKTSWKDNASGRLVINSFTNCAFNWKAGKEYILFLIKEKNGMYSTDRCLGNRAGDDAEAIKWLDEYGHKMKVVR